MRTARNIGYILGLPVLLVLVWWLSTLGSVNFFVPKPADLVETFGEVWFGDRFFSDVLPSLGRLVVGVAVAILIGVVGGVLI